MKDLRGNWVFPRVAYAATGEAIDRNIRRLFRFLIRRPGNRVIEFFATLRDHQSLVEILLAGFAVLAALVRALALLVLAIGSLYIALHRF
jgi:hypothetical protein